MQPSSDLVRALVDGSPDAILLVNGDGKIAFASALVESLFGWRPDEIAGRPIEDLIPPAFETRHKVLRAGYHRQSHARPMGQGAVLTGMHRDGSFVPVDVSLRPLETEQGQFVIAAVRDAQVRLKIELERRELEREVTEARDHAEAVVESLGDGVLEVDMETQTVVATNRRFADIIGETTDSIVGTVLTGSPHWLAAPHGSTAPFDAIFHDTERRRAECELMHRDGRSIPCLLSASTITRATAALRVVLVHDMTLERGLSRQLEDAQSQIMLADERDRIARDLHDGVIQRLYAAGLHLQASRSSAAIGDRIDVVIDEIDSAITDIRSTIFAMQRPRGLSESFEAGVRIAIAEATRILGHAPTLRLDGNLLAVATDLAREALSVLRELLMNVAKHAHSEHTDVHIEVLDDELVVTVHDLGVGLSPATDHGGQGLHNLRERADKRRGSFTIEPVMLPGDGDRSEPRVGGTLAIWKVPLRS